MSKLNCAFLLTIIFFPTEQTRAESKKTHMAHSHHSEHNGAVIMLGDDHFEFVRESKSMVHVFASDKFREPVMAGEFSLEFSLLSNAGSPNEQKKTLSYNAYKEKPYAIMLQIPANSSEKDVIEFKAPRLQLPKKGYISSNKPQRISLEKIPKAQQGKHKH